MNVLFGSLNISSGGAAGNARVTLLCLRLVEERQGTHGARRLTGLIISCGGGPGNTRFAGERMKEGRKEPLS